MKNYQKYQRDYFLPPTPSFNWVLKDHLDKVPVWCSVDLRDGNQALVEPMSLEEKLEFYQLLLKIGFKEIEVGFPAASETEYQFLRAIIEKGLIPKDVSIQVLTQAREHIIRKTFEAVKGAPRAIVHLYNSTSVAQREQVFRKSKKEVKELAVEGAKLLKELAQETEGDFSFQYSPESFPGTEVDYALEVCNSVIDIWQPDNEHRVIVNIPTTVENAMPHVFAQQVEYLSSNLKCRENVILSLHPHNDRGCGVCDAELGILAGADRIEGTLFGNGERTGNVDIITLAMNLFSHGVDPGLDFSDMPYICEKYERLTGMSVNERQPYAGSLVFTAFSGSHQDAIAKGIKWREERQGEYWTVPYLPIDPKDVGREYDSDVIRINSQSGKGGVSFILQRNFGLYLPEKMKEEMGYLAKAISDREHKELTPEGIYKIFQETYLNTEGDLHIAEFHFQKEQGIKAEVAICQREEQIVINGQGNGRLDAVNNALKSYLKVDYELAYYEQHSLGTVSTAQAISYVGLTSAGKVYWGAGIDEDIIKSSILALVVAVNRLGRKAPCKTVNK